MEKTKKVGYVLVGGMLVVGLVVMLIARWVSGPVDSIGGVSTPTDWFIVGCLGIVAILSWGYAVWAFLTWARERAGQ